VPRIALVAITLFGLAERLHAADLANEMLPDGPERLTSDEPGYNNLALGLLNGDGFVWPHRVPVYPLFLALEHWAVQGYDPIPYVQAVVGTLVVPATYLLGRRLAGQAVGLLAAAAAAFCPPLVDTVTPLMSEALFVPLVPMVALALVWAFEEPSPKRMALAGALLGLSLLVRLTLVLALVIVPIVLLFLLGRRRGVRLGATYALACVLVVLPWSVHNAIKWDTFLPFQTSSAILWQGSPEYFHLARDKGYAYLDIWENVIYRDSSRNRDPTWIDGDRYWTRRALRSIENEPLLYLRYAAEKTVTFWIGDPTADWGGSHPFDLTVFRAAGYSRTDKLEVVVFRALPLLLIPAIALLWRRGRVFAPVYALMGAATLLAAATHAEIRLSVPLLSLVFVVLASAIVAVVTRRRARGAVSPSA
jgi:4-amino-4-deoxy-L-arabinose transferase-like glycosyltransferase